MRFSRELGGVDFFHLIRDREMRERGLAGNHCAFVIDVEGRVDERALDRRIARVAADMPELRARLKNGFPPRWVEGDAVPEVRVRDGAPIGDLLEDRVDGA